MYTTTAAAANVWEVSPCKGDMNSDGSVNMFDVDPFVDALADLGDYSEDYAGLGATGVYHGDMNCDGSLNMFDVDPFVLRLTDAGAYWDATDCDPCEPPGDGMGGGGGSSAGEVAALLERYVDAGSMPFVIEIAKQLAAELTDEDRAKFWSDVYDALDD